MHFTLFCDLDGTLADLDTHYRNMFGEQPGHHVPWSTEWKRIENTRDFFLGIPPMPDMQTLWDFIKPYKPVILTGIPISIKEAADNKRAWVAKHLGPDVEVHCCLSKHKYLHCVPGDILIDDWEKYKDSWTGAGGIWITHTSAENTIKRLRTIERLKGALEI